MNLPETAELLALCAAFDCRTVGEADVYAWQSVLETVDLDTGKAAVTAHYAVKRERIMPADINAHAKARRARQREEAERRQLASGRRLALAPLPGRFGHRQIGEPTRLYDAAKETLTRLRDPEPSRAYGQAMDDMGRMLEAKRDATTDQPEPKETAK